MKKVLLLIALLIVTAIAEENPWEDEEDFECYAESGMSCEEMAEEWDENHPKDEDEEKEYDDFEN